MTEDKRAAIPPPRELGNKQRSMTITILYTIPNGQVRKQAQADEYASEA